MVRKASLNILIVDDFPNMRRMLTGILKRSGFKVVLEAASAQEAVSLMQNSLTKGPRLDLIVSDWSMPTMSGFEFLQEVRRTKEYENIPFIMLTAISDAVSISDAIKNGVTDYILKPFSPVIFERKVYKALGMEIGDDDF